MEDNTLKGDSMTDDTLEDNASKVCENCGASISIHDPKCPFCGHINQLGAEEKYMRDMEHIKSELEKTDEEHAKLIRKGTGNGWKIVLITVLVIVIILGSLAVLYTVHSMRMQKHYEELGVYETDTVKAAKWNDEHLGELNSMYDAGDIEGLLEYYGRMREEGNEGVFNNWSHAFLISQIENLRFWAGCLDDAAEPDSLTIHQIMFNLLYYYNGDYKGTTMPEEDYDFMLEEVDVFTEKVTQRFGITEDFISKMNEACVGDYGYIDPEKVDDYCDSYRDKFR